jgi:uncharacterized protein
MKKVYALILIAILLAAGVQIFLDYGGYHKIPVEGGTLYGRATGNDKELVVLLIAGSGPTDMDGNTVLIQGRNDSLRLLAQDLAKAGVSVFRYDKRSAGKSVNTFDPAIEIDFNTFVQDCVKVIEYLKGQGYKNVVLAGHSKGSLVGMLASQQTQVAGFISLAGTGLPIDVTLEKQLLAQLPEDSHEFRVIEGLRNGIIDTSIPEDQMFSPSQQAFLMSWMPYDPGAIIAELDIPVLVIQGDEDIQVDMDDFEPLRANVSTESYRIIEGMNHVLKDVRSTGDPNLLASYSDPSYPLHSDLVPAILEYLQKLS